LIFSWCVVAYEEWPRAFHHGRNAACSTARVHRGLHAQSRETLMPAPIHKRRLLPAVGWQALARGGRFGMQLIIRVTSCHFALHRYRLCNHLTKKFLTGLCGFVCSGCRCRLFFSVTAPSKQGCPGCGFGRAGQDLPGDTAHAGEAAPGYWLTVVWYWLRGCGAAAACKPESAVGPRGVSTC